MSFPVGMVLLHITPRAKSIAGWSGREPEVRLTRKGNRSEARLAFMGHTLMKNGKGLLTDFVVRPARGH